MRSVPCQRTLCRLFLFRTATVLSGANFEGPVGVLQAFEGLRETTELFIFTPPGAAIRFADGARKSFSIATCLAR